MCPTPIELRWTIGKDWKQSAEVASERELRPDVLRLLGSSDEAIGLRKAYADAITQTLSRVDATSLHWDTLAGIMCTTALQILGPIPTRKTQPWFKGKERELKALEDAVHEAETQLLTARRQRLPQVEVLLQARRDASKRLSACKRQWEAQWWDDLALQADAAAQSGNEFAFWQVCRQLGLRDHPCSRTPSRRTVANPDLDREAWKHFLSGIQADSGEVNPAVWEFVPVAPAPDPSLPGLPSRAEFEAALSSMRNGKRGGVDNVTIELVRYGGDVLQQEVFSTLQQMWSDAATAEPGHEADTWAQSAKTGIRIPVFKNKGARSERTNYRNLVMLSVAAKLVARIAATRLSKWSEAFLSEEQHGFRSHQGIDDAHQVARRVIEEVVLSSHESRVAVTSFDIVRAYTRVCTRAVAPADQTRYTPPFLQVLKALRALRSSSTTCTRRHGSPSVG